MTVGDRKVFGSGTRLYVTESNADKVVPPTLSGYLPSTTNGKFEIGKQAVLCQATNMFPDLVRFTWQKKSSTADWTDVAESKVVEQRDDKEKIVTVTSMMILDEKPAKDDLYKCTAIHEGGTNNFIELKKDKKDPPKKPSNAIPETKSTCPPKTEETRPEQKSDTSENMRRLYVFVYGYGVMLMKNGVYFCVISIFLLKRKYGKKEESS